MNWREKRAAIIFRSEASVGTARQQGCGGRCPIQGLGFVDRDAAFHKPLRKESATVLRALPDDPQWNGVVVAGGL